jgi:hypothetical protein
LINELTRHETSRIRNGKLESRRRGPLVVAGRVVRVPDQHAGHAAVHADSHEARHGEPHVGRGDVCDDGVAGDGDGEGEEHDDAAEFEAVGCECDNHYYRLSCF